ncbi:hypothetical protein C8R47DRAFT_1076233 [Mycena vitilis]|nr:hypothetical protein C8R47DRAFT_1076233 [Mycena vitilis]
MRRRQNLETPLEGLDLEPTPPTYTLLPAVKMDDIRIQFREQAARKPGPGPRNRLPFPSSGLLDTLRPFFWLPNHGCPPPHPRPPVFASGMTREAETAVLEPSWGSVASTLVSSIYASLTFITSVPTRPFTHEGDEPLSRRAHHCLSVRTTQCGIIQLYLACATSNCTFNPGLLFTPTRSQYCVSSRQFFPLCYTAIPGVIGI